MQGSYNERERVARQLENVRGKFEELSIRITLPEVIGDTALFTALMRDHSELAPLAELAEAFFYLQKRIDEAREMLEYADMADMAREELLELEPEMEVLVRRELVKNKLANWFGDSFDQLEIAATYNLIVNAAFMVEQGLGVALCFDLGAVFENLRFVPLAPRMETGSVLVWKKNQTLSTAHTLFIQHIRNAF